MEALTIWQIESMRLIIVRSRRSRPLPPNVTLSAPSTEHATRRPESAFAARGGTGTTRVPWRYVGVVQCSADKSVGLLLFNMISCKLFCPDHCSGNETEKGLPPLVCDRIACMLSGTSELPEDCFDWSGLRRRLQRQRELHCGGRPRMALRVSRRVRGRRLRVRDRGRLR